MENILIVVGIIIVSRAGNEIYQKEGTKAFRAQQRKMNKLFAKDNYFVFPFNFYYF